MQPSMNDRKEIKADLKGNRMELPEDQHHQRHMERRKEPIGGLIREKGRRKKEAPFLLLDRV